MVYVLGGWQSDFSQNWARQQVDFTEAFTEAVRAGLDATQLEPSEIDTGHVGNFVGELFAGQGLLGGFFGLVHPDFNGMPTMRHEAACASGSLAVLAASAEIEAGRYETACVVGIELMRNVSGLQASQNLGAAIWAGREFQDATFIWPRVFSDVGLEYERRYGLDYNHLMRIAEINFANAKKNPNAQTRQWAFQEGSFTANDELNPPVEGMIRRNDCGQVTDGAAVVFLASEAFAKTYADRRGIPLESLPRIKGWGHTSGPISYDLKLRSSDGHAYLFPKVKQAVDDARRRAGIADVSGIDAVETHDCFTTTEYMAIDHLGLTQPGEAWKAVEDGSIEIGGRLPINPSGGLIGAGHPVGATGVRMVLDSFKQVTGKAGDYQVEGARNVQTLNIGGSATTTVSLVVGL